MTLRHILCSVATVFLIAPSLASGKTYEGDEAAALRCANTLAFTAVALAEEGRLGEVEKEVMLEITVLILELHVSGTWSQKKAALRIVRDRRDALQTLSDYERFALQCFERFPIN